MVPSPMSTALALTTFAAAVKVLLQNSDTPKIIRDKLARFAAELRDELGEMAARMVDGAEAELVIQAYAETSPVFPPDADSHQSHRQTLHALEAISVDSA